jgi:hypothetical protein
MSLRGDLAAAQAMLCEADYLGVAVVYNGVPITALVRYGDSPNASAAKNVQNVNRRGADTADLIVTRSQLGSWAVGDSVVIDGVTWRVAGQHKATSGYFKLAMETKPRRPL